MSRWQPKRPFREHPAVVQRRNRAYLDATAPTEGPGRERFEKMWPESDLPPLPKKRGPRPKSAGNSEHQEQSAVIDWWSLAHKQYGVPEFSLFAVPNGGARDAITGFRLKAEGVRPGTPDLVLAVPTQAFRGLFLEMKKIDGAKAPPEQIAFRDYLRAVGYSAGVYYGADIAIKAIEEYLR